MSTPEPSKTPWPYPMLPLHACLVTGAIVGGLVCWSTQTPQQLSSENGGIENAQMVLLGLTALLGTLAAYRAAFSERQDASFWSHLAFGILCVAMLGLVRETQSFTAEADLSGFSLDKSLKRGLTGFFAVAWMGAAIRSWVKDRRFIWCNLHVRFLWPLAPFVACFVCAEICEEISWVATEETLEVFAYSMLALTNLWIIRSSRMAASAQQADLPVLPVEDTLVQSPDDMSPDQSIHSAAA